MARYREVAEDLRRRIAAGEFMPGDRLPSISELQEHYAVPGLNTIRQGQQLLVEEGLIETRQGSGAFVLRAPSGAGGAAAGDERRTQRDVDAAAVLAAAGISVEDLEVVVVDRVAHAKRAALEALDALRAVRIDVGPGAEVPGTHRYGKGARLTDADMVGAWRVLAASAHFWELEAAHVDVDKTRDATLHGMARREHEGRHEDNVLLLDMARSAVERSARAGS